MAVPSGAEKSLTEIDECSLSHCKSNKISYFYKVFRTATLTFLIAAASSRSEQQDVRSIWNFVDHTIPGRFKFIFKFEDVRQYR